MSEIDPKTQPGKQCNHGLHGDHAVAVRAIYDRSVGPTFWINGYDSIICAMCFPTHFCQHSRYKGKCEMCRMVAERDKALMEANQLRMRLCELEHGDGNAKKRKPDVSVDQHTDEGK